MSVVKLYYSGGTYGKWVLNPGRLLCVDNIATYLSGKSALTLNTMQYQKLELEKTLKVDLSQSYAVPKTGTSFKYVSIQNTDEQIHYYFVKNILWKSKSCTEFELVLDVLNTFIEGTDYDFKPSTNIIREHKDRFKKGKVTASFSYQSIADRDGWFDPGDVVHWEDLDGTHVDFEGTLISIDEHGFIIEFDSAFTEDAFEKWLVKVNKPTLVGESDWIWFNQPTIYDIQFNWYRLIDYIPEGINPTLHAGSGEGEKSIDVPQFDQTWHLLYRNVNDPDPDNLVDPVECYIIPDKWISVKTSSITNGRINYTSFDIGKCYFIPFEENSYADIITLDDGTILGSGLMGTGDTYGYLCLYRSSNNHIVVIAIIKYGPDDDTKAKAWESTYITANHLPLAYTKNDIPTYPRRYVQWKNIADNGTAGSWTSGSVNVTTDDITDLDRTDPKNIKLIKLPYIPYDFAITGGVIDISSDPNWSYADFEQANGSHIKALKLNNLNVKLERNIDQQYGGNGYFNLRARDEIAINSASKSDLRVDADLESKLFASEFYQPTYFYDSFSYKINLEDLDVEEYISDKNDFSSFGIRFECTSTINSRFMFTFTDLKFRFASSNYANVMPIIRNNEEVLYNVPYVNYIRTGFNYDVKSKNIQFGSNIANIAMSGGSILASLLIPSIPIKAAGLIGSIASFANGIKNAIVSAKNAENSIESKLKQAENQKASVQGADDVDLMTSYTENRLKYLEYVPTPLMRDMIDDLFFYAGYRSGRTGLPNHTTRINFDYLECNAQFEDLRSIPSDCLQELINCFKSGVTYLHYNSNISGGYDFSQTHENWERSLFD